MALSPLLISLCESKRENRPQDHLQKEWSENWRSVPRPGANSFCQCIFEHLLLPLSRLTHTNSNRRQREIAPDARKREPVSAVNMPGFWVGVLPALSFPPAHAFSLYLFSRHLALLWLFTFIFIIFASSCLWFFLGNFAGFLAFSQSTFNLGNWGFLWDNTTV